MSIKNRSPRNRAKPEQAKAESVLMNLLSQPFKDLYYFWEFDFSSVSNVATIGEVLKAYEAEYKR